MNETIVLYGTVSLDIATRDPLPLLNKLPGRALKDSVLKYQRPYQQWMSLMGKCLLLQGLRQLIPAAASVEELCYGKFGQPYLPGGPSFSISHSKGWVTCAISTTGGIGIDIQKEISLDDRRLSKVFSQLELEYWRRGRGSAAYYWSRKEALSKLLGYGMRMDYRKLVVIDEQVVYGGQNYRLFNIQAPAGFCCNLATEGPITLNKRQVFRFSGPPAQERLRSHSSISESASLINSL